MFNVRTLTFYTMLSSFANISIRRKKIQRPSICQAKYRILGRDKFCHSFINATNTCSLCQALIKVVGLYQWRKEKTKSCPNGVYILPRIGVKGGDQYEIIHIIKSCGMFEDNKYMENREQPWGILMVAWVAILISVVMVGFIEQVACE